ncbi:MAG: conserved rane protein of unknown function, partial [Frankiales bacterium]|nr:conserved rane protein of unknown function [Frankiales bacterium]
PAVPSGLAKQCRPARPSSTCSSRRFRLPLSRSSVMAAPAVTRRPGVPAAASAVGYARSTRTGAAFYNLAHSYPAPALLGAVAVATSDHLWQAVALVWLAHIGMDRALGYGLKYDDSFKHTHLGSIGR